MAGSLARVARELAMEGAGAGDDAGIAGDIPVHCHLVRRADDGMMAVLRIVQAGPAPRPAR
jgi:hypothetical protein